MKLRFPATPAQQRDTSTTQQRPCRDNAANDCCAADEARGLRLQVELDAPLLRALLRDKHLKAGQLQACNPESAWVIHDLLLDCLAPPGRRDQTTPAQSPRRRS